MYEEGFYRLNVEQIEHHVRRGRHFVWDAGQRELFSQVWVVPKVKFADYNVDRMRQYVDVMFAPTVQNCKQFYLTLDDEFTLYSMYDLYRTFTAVCRVPGTDRFVDLHRDGIINGSTEHIEYITPSHLLTPREGEDCLQARRCHRSSNAFSTPVCIVIA